eukprot:CAMPEP_0194514650 /NCGR_PEP_ID=MMETSP0253-20130528/47145_1 /TAXON_ID=2966 /ORGANISM="Noctiluca scintillans" /LENGTH=552 /DNA_ID=CAMNT_0039358335 /DNA_START=77 /DNA_END=1735 /DNA_ORIENTATION=-
MIIPIVWSAFVAVPLTVLISHIQALVNVLGCFLFNVIRRALGVRAPDDEVAFVHFRAKVPSAGENIVYLENSYEVKRFLRRVMDPCGCVRRSSSVPHRFGGRWCVRRCLRRRVRIRSIDRDHDQSPKVNRLVTNWSYHMRLETTPAQVDTTQSGSAGVLLRTDETDSTSEADPQPIRLSLFLDKNGRFPAIWPDVDGRGSMLSLTVHGTIEVDTDSVLSWGIAMIICVGLVAVVFSFLVWTIISGEKQFQNNINAYKTGVTEVLTSLKRFLPTWMMDRIDAAVTDWLQNSLPALITGIIGRFRSMGFEAVLFLVYLCFWVAEPLPVDDEVAKVFQKYIFLKTIVCFLYGGLMSFLLVCLECKLASLFFVVTLVLNYIPEFGAILSGILMIPAVLLDGSVQPPERRLANTMYLAIFGVLIKILTGNVIEVQLYVTHGGHFMRMHPVILMALMMMCQQLLGLSGLFLAIPLIAAVKFYLLSSNMPSEYRNPLVTLIEGDVTGPHKNHPYVESFHTHIARARESSARDSSIFRSRLRPAVDTEMSHSFHLVEALR